MNDQEYSYLRNHIYKLTNVDLDCYKSEQMRRRLDGFLNRYNYTHVAAYCNLLETNPDKQTEFLDFMAINVSEFFRDAEQFKYLKKTVIPQLLEHHPKLNIWSAACSCGQEPYSIAMILEEFSTSFHHVITATDIDESALQQAKNGGPYSLADIKNVEKPLLEKYFIKKENGYWIDEKIKKKITFKRHNLLHDPFDVNFDLIVCRNVIIYFSDVVRDNIYKRFHSSLKPGGFMFLGGSEVVLLPSKNGFSMINPSFYRKDALNLVTAKSRNVFSEVAK
jgi:chemotaxis protein methyltransferase CheR